MSTQPADGVHGRFDWEAAASKEPTVDDKWTIIPAFVEARGLAKQHIDSFNYFVNTEIKQIVMAASNRRITSDVDHKWFFEYTDVYIEKPVIQDVMVSQEASPHMCRLRDITYAGEIKVDVKFFMLDFSGRPSVQTKRAITIGHMPIMLRSDKCHLSGKSLEGLRKMGECQHDPGGYFVVNGSEKVLLMQEQLSNNRIIVDYDSKKMITAYVTSRTTDNTSRTTVCYRKEGKEGLFVKTSAFADMVPVVILLRAMGMESDQEIVQMVGTEKHLLDGLILSIKDAFEQGVFTQEQALTWLKSKVKLRSSTQKPTVGDVLQGIYQQILSHIETPGGEGDRLDFSAKSRYLCLMVRRMLDASSEPKLYIDDRDYYGNKRLEMSGQLLALLFEDLFKSMNAEIKKAVDQALQKYKNQQSTARNPSHELYPDPLSTLNPIRITKGLQHAISSGNWNIKRFRIDRSGVSQVLSRLSYISVLGAMTRVKSQFEKSRKLAGPRALQPSQWGMLCPSDTPEGEQCGLVKHLALMAHVTTPLPNERPLKDLCFALGTEDAAMLTGQELHSKDSVLVFLNGSLLGVHKDPQSFMKQMRLLRRAGHVGEFCSIYEHESLNAVFIASDGGRLCRPLIICENGVPRLKIKEHLSKLHRKELSFDDFLKKGIIEWLDVNEENNCDIALKWDAVQPYTTHLEIDPLALLGSVTGLVPYPHHNQSPRNTYQCAMGKQAMGAIATNQHLRVDTQVLLLSYPQRPMCKSRTLEMIGWENLPAGHNASVAVMSYSGYDIEDAIVMNKGSLDRGFGRCCTLKRYVTHLERYQNGSCDALSNPVLERRAGQALGSGPRGGMSRVDKRKLGVDASGTVMVGSLVTDGDVLVNKVSPKTVDSSSAGGVRVLETRDTPLCYKNPVGGYVDRVLLTDNSEQKPMFKVMMRQTRRPELGDKFSSRHGQKGVVGLIVPQENMPFSEKGWCPDLIMNPHGFPSRMTVGKLLECLSGKAVCVFFRGLGVMDGKFAYGTVFGGTKRSDIERSLISHGFAPSGKEYLTCGITGEALQCYIYVGPIYYQKLKHMVQDKIHARSQGPRQTLTRQPTEGRAKDGGLRIGEMERDCFVAYGASNLLLERLMLSSDVFHLCICRRCGLIAKTEKDCASCGVGEFVVQIRIPYACKLMFQELQSMNVVPRFKLQQH